MSITDTAEVKFEKAQEIFYQLDADMPTRIWVEGDGKMYGDFQSNSGQRRPLTQFDVIQLVHKAHIAAAKLISI